MNKNNSQVIFYFIYLICYTFIWLSFIAYIIYRSNNFTYLWLLVPMFLCTMSFKSERSEISNSKDEED